MLKKNFKVLSIIFTIIVLMCSTFVFAENEDTLPISENSDNEITNQNDDTTASSDNSFKKSDVYLTGDNITIDYIIDGNLFVIANNVTINSQIGGDAFICAKSLTIGEEGYVFSNLFTVCSSLDIKGIVYDTYAISKDITTTGYIYRDFKTICDTFNVFGTIGRNAYVNCSNIIFTQNNENVANSQGLITGNLNYSSTNEISIPKSSVNGEINFEKTTNIRNIQTYLISLGSTLALTIVIWLLLLWLAPKFLEKADNILLTKNMLKVVGFGLLSLIILPIISIILLFIGITVNISLLLTFIYMILMCISCSIFTITLNNFICKKLKITKKAIIFGILVATGIVLWGLSLIPYLGQIISFICIILGLGIIITYLISKKSFSIEKTTNE